MSEKIIVELTREQAQAVMDATELLARLEIGRTITPKEADDMFACTRLGARIWDLRKRGYPIISERVDGVNKFGDKCHWARYRMGARA